MYVSSRFHSEINVRLARLLRTVIRKATVLSDCKRPTTLSYLFMDHLFGDISENTRSIFIRKKELYVQMYMQIWPPNVRFDAKVNNVVKEPIFVFVSKKENKFWLVDSILGYSESC